MNHALRSSSAHVALPSGPRDRALVVPKAPRTLVRGDVLRGVLLRGVLLPGVLLPGVLLPGVLLCGVQLLAACPGVGPEDAAPSESDGGVEIVDSGLPADAGADAGPDAGAGAGEGEGEGEGEGGVFCDGGLCADAGIEGDVYFGSEEPGVVCSGAPCADSQSCCVTAPPIAATCVDEASMCAGAFLAATLGCDGPEDCGDGEECCIGTTYSSACVAAGTCESDGMSSVVCIDGNDCLDDQLCCGLAVGTFELPVDLGVCAPAVNNCELQAP